MAIYNRLFGKKGRKGRNFLSKGTSGIWEERKEGKELSQQRHILEGRHGSFGKGFSNYQFNNLIAYQHGIFFV